jgi:hypothetical protein
MWAHLASEVPLSALRARKESVALQDLVDLPADVRVCVVLQLLQKVQAASRHYSAGKVIQKLCRLAVGSVVASTGRPVGCGTGLVLCQTANVGPVGPAAATTRDHLVTGGTHAVVDRQVALEEQIVQGIERHGEHR